MSRLIAPIVDELESIGMNSRCDAPVVYGHHGDFIEAREAYATFVGRRLSLDDAMHLRNIVSFMTPEARMCIIPMMMRWCIEESSGQCDVLDAVESIIRDTIADNEYLGPARVSRLIGCVLRYVARDFARNEHFRSEPWVKELRSLGKELKVLAAR